MAKLSTDNRMKGKYSRERIERRFHQIGNEFAQRYIMMEHNDFGEECIIVVDNELGIYCYSQETLDYTATHTDEFDWYILAD